MATVNDIGVPGQPATNLTAWQAAVRDTCLQVKGPTAGGILSMGSMGAVGAGSQYTVAIVFPAGRFTTPPIVQAVVSQFGGAVASGYKAAADPQSKITLTVSGVTATGFSVTAHFPVAITLSASQEIHWSATPRA